MTRFVALALVLGACGGSPAPATSTVRIGDVVIRVEVADTPAERARGLIGRPSLAPGTGMLFLFDPPAAPRTFWMKDTLIPLDLISIRAGRVAAIQRLEPCRADPCPETITPAASQALEVAAGAADEVSVGDLVAWPE